MSATANASAAPSYTTSTRATAAEQTFRNLEDMRKDIERHHEEFSNTMQRSIGGPMWPETEETLDEALNLCRYLMNHLKTMQQQLHAAQAARVNWANAISEPPSTIPPGLARSSARSSGSTQYKQSRKSVHAMAAMGLKCKEDHGCLPCIGPGHRKECENWKWN